MTIVNYILIGVQLEDVENAADKCGRQELEKLQMQVFMSTLLMKFIEFPRFEISLYPQFTDYKKKSEP